MSTRVVHSIEDFIRHGMSIEIRCRCGHWALLEPRWVHDRFGQKGWQTSLTGFGDSAYKHFYCSKCFLRHRRIERPQRIGPGCR